ncbi:MAG: secretin N-terminal domain-containing protein [Mariprofundaceae bacterium]|nr:secretin N-terminal domain-containing protein [Mariprofundaceae bacterium]
MIRLLAGALLLLSLWLPGIALAETAIFEIHYLPLQEAKTIVKSQLSKSGTIAALPSRGILLVNDDARHIDQARRLLKRLDAPATQYTATLELLSLNEEQARFIKTSARLPGGWIRIVLAESAQSASSRKQYNLLLTSGRQGSIESGIIQPYRQQTRQWLAGYGIIAVNSVELVPITSGFNATAAPAGEGMVNVRIVPWMREHREDSGREGNTEIVINPGAANAPVRLNANQAMHRNQGIEMAGAATEVTIAVGETVTIAASNEEAGMLGDALLSGGSSGSKKSFAIRLRIEQR